MLRRMRRTAVGLLGLVLVAACSPGGSGSGDPTSSSSPTTTASSAPAGSPSLRTSPGTSPRSNASGDGGSAASSGVGRYVALGDSYSAGPLIPTTDLAGGCLRSNHNYPSLLARRLDVASFVDRTCSGATTRDLDHPHVSFGGRLPAQLDAVTRGTDLVTVGIGGNDLDLFSTFVQACTQLRGSDPTGSPCARRLASRGLDPATATARIGRRVAASLREVHARAPRAEVVLVGYLRLAPQRGTCASLPFARGDYATARRVSRELDAALVRAARATGTAFVDMYAASRGHDVCSSDPWVNGAVTDRTKALAFHPLLAGMRADADRVATALASGASPTPRA